MPDGAGVSGCEPVGCSGDENRGRQGCKQFSVEVPEKTEPRSRSQKDRKEPTHITAHTQMSVVGASAVGKVGSVLMETGRQSESSESKDGEHGSHEVSMKTLSNTHVGLDSSEAAVFPSAIQAQELCERKTNCAQVRKPNVAHVEDRAGCPTPGCPWREAAKAVVQDAAASSSDGARGSRDVGEEEGDAEPAAVIRNRIEQGCTEEIDSPGILDGTDGTSFDRQREHDSTQGQGHEGSLRERPSSPERLCGIRQACRQTVWGNQGRVPVLCQVGAGHRQGVQRHRSKTPSLGKLVEGGSRDGECPRGWEIPTGPQDQGESGLWLNEEGGTGARDIVNLEERVERDQPVTCGSEIFDHGGGGNEDPGAGDPPEATLGRRLKRMGEDVHQPDGPALSQYDEGPMETMKEGPVCLLSDQQAREVSFKAMREIPEAFEDLVRSGRPLLYEIACGPDSVLTNTMRKKIGRESAAERLSFWNGFDLATSFGVRKTLNKIDEGKPLSVWISTECGPFSRMQHVNQRTEEQIAELKRKRENCIRQYVGGLIVMTHCIQKGITCTWEWSETSEAWRLPMVQKVLSRFEVPTCVVKGCRVGLQVPNTRKLLGKGWKLATTHDGILRYMNLPCRCEGRHSWCEGKLTRMSAYYTDEFARRVCHAICSERERDDLIAELRGAEPVPAGRKPEEQTCSCALVQHPRSELVCNLCEMKLEKQHVLSLAAEDLEVELPPLSEAEKAKHLRSIALIHRNTGHSAVENLVKSLQARGTDPRIVQLAREFTCSICQEAKRMVPRPRVSLEPLPPKWKVIQADNAFWTHPHTHKKYQFTLLIDEGCRFRIARLMDTGPGRGIRGEDMVKVYQEMWKPIFGIPDKLRVDPAGPWRSGFVDEYMSNQGVELETIPAEAHWQISHVERAIRCTKHILSKLVAEDANIPVQEALAEAIRTENEREVVRGYSPAQHALGRAPDEAGRFHASELRDLPPGLCENGEGDFQRNVERMRCAEQAMAEWVAQDRISRAKNTRSYKVEPYVPGDLVYVWRVQTRGPANTARAGGFTGPARVLALETRLTDDGNYRPGSIVWVVRGSRLIKTCPEQLRKASTREECIENLVNPPKLPWTFTKLTEDVGRHYFEDATHELPDRNELQQAIDEETIRPFKRVRRKSHVPECPPPQRISDDMEDDLLAECFWNQEHAAVEIEVSIPESKRGLQHMVNHLDSFLVSNLKKRAVEVSERSLNADEWQEMQQAKHEEVKKFIGAEALEALPEHLRPPRQVAMRMRWILTWKRDEAGYRKAKARCVILGYMDPKYAERQVAAPTMSRTTRQLLLVISAAMGFKIAKGDVSGAFLQGREYQGDSYVVPTDEICHAMGLAPGSTTRLKKACYGLVDAPLEWFLTVSDYLTLLGFERCVTDPCCFKYVEGNKLLGLISGHVDDFLFCGPEENEKWKSLCKQIREKFHWGTWETGAFTQCGVHIKERSEGGYELSQTQYIDDLKEMSISAERRREPKAATTEREKSSLRAALGALSWCAQQCCPQIGAAVSLFLSQVLVSTVSTLLEVNKLIYSLKCQRKHRLLIHAHDVNDLLVAGWADASVQNRVDGKSTQGIIIGITSRKLMEGDLCPVSPVTWNASKIGRQCRSPGAAECLATVNGEDQLFAVRLQLCELLGTRLRVRESAKHVKSIKAVLVTDSTNVFDKMRSTVYVPKGPEHRTALEMIGLKEALVETDLVLRWVHSDAQLANSLTKEGEGHQLERFYQLQQHWRIVEDPLMQSAKNRRKLGLGVLENCENQDDLGMLVPSHPE